jgi:hypothetical protein
MLGALVLALLSAEEPALAGAPGRLSWQDARSLEHKLASIERHHQLPPPRPRRTVTVTEGELNSYLNLSLASKMPEGVSDVRVHLEPERLVAEGQVDLERVRGETASSGITLNPLALLAGQVPLYLRGRFQNKDGFGTIEWEEVRISSIRLPVSVLGQLVASSTKGRRYPEGWDIHAPFRLPYSARRIRLAAGQAFLDF